MMKVLLMIITLVSQLAAGSQTLRLSSLQHEIRWLEEARFPPFVTGRIVQDSLLRYSASMLAKKFGAIDYTLPAKIDYRNITMFGKPNMKPPESMPNPDDYSVSVLSFITRATTGFEVLWTMKAVVHKNGNSIYSREIKHEILNYSDSIAWFNEESFVNTYKTLFDELLEESPPLSGKFILGAGINYDSVLQAKSDAWTVSKHANIFGFGQPQFGPYTTINAGKLDTPVIKTSSKQGSDFSIGFSEGKVFFGLDKTYDRTKTKFCSLLLTDEYDTIKAYFAVGTRSTEVRTTVAGPSPGGFSGGSNSQTMAYDKDVWGTIITDSVSWDFLVKNYLSDGTIGGGYLVYGEEEYQLSFVQHEGAKWEYITRDKNGEYFASLVTNFTKSKLFIRKDLKPNSQKAMACLYTILMSTRFQ